MRLLSRLTGISFDAARILLNAKRAAALDVLSNYLGQDTRMLEAQRALQFTDDGPVVRGPAGCCDL